MTMSVQLNIGSSGTRPFQSLAISSRPVDGAPFRARSVTPSAAHKASCCPDSSQHRTRIEGSFEDRDDLDIHASTLEPHDRSRAGDMLEKHRNRTKEGNLLRWGPAPKPPGFIALIPIPRFLGLSLKRSAVNDTPPRSWTLGRRSGCFPALPYPPPRPEALYSKLRCVPHESREKESEFLI